MWTAGDPFGCLKIITWCCLKYHDIFQLDIAECRISHPVLVITACLKWCSSQGHCCLGLYLNFTLITKTFHTMGLLDVKTQLSQCLLLFSFCFFSVSYLEYIGAFMRNCTKSSVNVSLSGAQRKGMEASCYSHLLTELYLPKREKLKPNNSSCCASPPRSHIQYIIWVSIFFHILKFMKL